MTKQEYIDYWLEGAVGDWHATQSLTASSSRHALVFAHWTLEKLSKALWVQHNQDIPPTTDTVTTILTDTPFPLTSAQRLFTQHLEAAHDEVLEPDPAQPLQLPETTQELLDQAGTLREQLLEALRPVVR